MSMVNHPGEPARQDEHRRWTRLEKWILGLALLAFPLALAAFVLALNAGGDTVYEAGSLRGDEAAAIAAEALKVAEQNNESVGVILSFLEGGSVLLTLIIAVAASFSILNVRELRREVEAQADANRRRIDQTLRAGEAELNRLGRELEQAVTQTNKQIAELTENTRQRIAELTTQIRDQLDEARQTAENSFRVLSLQLLAEQQVRARNYETAIQSLQEAHALDADNQTTNYLLGYLYTARRKFERALGHLNRALEVNPDFAPALAALGLTQRRLGDQHDQDPDKRNRYYAEAELNLIRALDMDKSMVDADGESYFGTLGGLYRRQNRLDDATRAYERAVEVTPNNSYPVSNLASLYKHAGRDEKAEEMFQRTKEMAEALLDDRPADYWARFDLAQALLVLGQGSQALHHYQNVIARQPPVTALKSGLNTLEFLAASPKPIPNIEEALHLVQEAIAAHEAKEQP